ncbi:MAG: hypothetical protein KIA99_04395 [Actinomyces urogenitalis]|uniref:hypothetical protein n=1 Tax=Actinomyces urogenitalis TaxID=103621 RepID=UPI002432DFA8|nr:hypothetical protein [Actinomyces urogenitalis]MBS5976825.1 hypothetical protein [Actinomyces urogenitalis]MDU7427929.1 hypothetical protein [Actinomyces urogenitalis]
MTAATTRTKVPRKPQDHKTGADGTVTVHGVTISITSDDLDDFELIDYLSRVNDGDPLAVAPLLHRLIPDKAVYRQVMDVLRDPETGRVPTEAAATFMTELLGEVVPS